MDGLREFLHKGGFFMYLNIVVSGIVLAIIVERSYYLLGKGAINARAFLDQLKKLLASDQLERALKLCAAAGGAPVARVAQAGLSRMHKGELAVATGIEEALLDVAPDLKKRIPALWSLANIATLLGLLGTISGLIGAFAAVGSAEASKRSALLADRIAEAMYNTAMGLGIAVTCLIAHVLLSGMAKKLVADLEAFAMKLENVVAEGPSAEPTSSITRDEPPKDTLKDSARADKKAAAKK
jgi:biopolymer transport protein ExbB/TolQ